MDFGLTEQQGEIRSMVRGFAEKEIAPLASQIDREARIPDDLWRKVLKLNLQALPFPEEYGGLGSTFLNYILATEELAKASAVMAMIPTANVMVGTAIQQFGTEWQKKRYLVPLIKGEDTACWSFTEAATGSDPKAIETRAVLAGDEYIIPDYASSFILVSFLQ